VPGDEGSRQHRTGLALAVLAALVFSPAAVFIRLADGVTSREIAALRLFVAATMMAGAALLSRTSLRPPAGEGRRLAGCALVTAFHFWSFTAALERTSIAHALALTYTAPVFAAVFARSWLDEHLSTRQWVGTFLVVIAVGGLCFGMPSTSRALAGDGLALLSGASLGLYHVIGRALRHDIPLFRYAFWLYFGAALYLTLLAWPFPSTYPTMAIVGIVAQGALCTAVGHTLTNAALRRTATAYVSLLVTQEVTGGILVGMLALGETPPPATVAALLPLAAGLVLVLVGATSSR